VVTTLYAPAAQMIKRMKAAKRATMITSLSFAGASQLAKALGPDATGVSVALTVPPPRAQNVPVVRECAEAWAAAGHKEGMSVTALESCVAAKVMVEGMRRAGREVTRASLHRALSALGRYDAGGYVVDFKPNFRHGGSFVAMALLRPNGEVRD
jgi:branched-chain amino acid transport system substrate-binding protein